MNFFEAQDQSRRNTRRLVVLFAIATLLIVAASTLVIEAAFSMFNLSQSGAAVTAGQYGAIKPWAFVDPVRVAIIAGVVLLCILVASAFRIAQLGSGGSRIAQEMGGTLVTGNTQDLQRKRLLNVVEEMAIASGVPVPQVFVLEHEAGINAFAAGFTTSDAAVAVTRGTLETLNRAELQGVIAHEFSHILNGDMRLNLRLVGILFGIIIIGQVGRMMMRTGSRGRVSRRSNNGGNPALLVGIALFLIGAVGVLAARLIRAGVSRQREYLADASAVQFTRQTDGIAGALAKIGGIDTGSRLTEADGEEISHMLFARGGRRVWLSALASHPPLEDRIRKLDPALANRMVDANWQADALIRDVEAGVSGFAAYAGERVANFSAESLTERIGRPDDADIAVAAGLRNALPPSIEDAAHSPEWAFYLVIALATVPEPSERRNQMSYLLPRIGEMRLQRVDEYADSIHELGAQYRLPILELCFPALKERPSGQIRFLLDLIDGVIATTTHAALGQYALRQLLEYSLEASLNPASMARATRHLGQRDVLTAAADLLTIVAVQGSATPEAASQAARAGLAILGIQHAVAPRPLEDSANLLRTLQGMIGRDLHRLLRALLQTVQHDRNITLEEAELMRLICAALGCPLPPMIAEFAVNP
ncbi:MAG: M48 family metallopeptidase [Pseudomonadota bacterium]